MSHTAKAKAKGVSASSFFDLKAELSKQEVEFSKNKAAGKSTQILGGVKRPDKKPTVWGRQNKGVDARASRDTYLEEISKPTLESARAVLERKAKIYDKLRKGKTGGLSDKQYDALLVDFDNKPSDHYSSDSDDVDESLTVPKPPGVEDDPIIEYEDEFGRLRTARRSEVPRNLLPRDDDDDEEHDSDEDLVIRNPVNHYPTYQPSEERLAEIEKEYAEENNPLNVHYDATREVRAKGAGFYQFSADEETRLKQMEELRAVREETERSRKETGAVDVRPGEVEGMRSDVGPSSTKSRAMEKRKREIEERRKMLEEKRKKPRVVVDSQAPSVHSDSVSPPPPPQQLSKTTAEEKEIDPFAVLESSKSKAATATNKQGKQGTDKTKTRDADAFLAQLEHDFLKNKGR